MFVGAAYWAGWRVLLPKVFGYELVPRKETLEDGTVVTLVRVFIRALRTGETKHYHPVFAKENSVIMGTSVPAPPAFRIHARYA